MSSALDAASKMATREGAGAFFRGYTPSLLGVFGTQMYVSVLESTRTHLEARYATRPVAARLIQDPALAKSVRWRPAPRLFAGASWRSCKA